MHRIDTSTAVTSLPTPKQPGQPGFFTSGSPQTGQEATVVSDDWANAVQEEISNVIEASGLTLSKTDRTQLLQAIGRLTRIRLTAPITFYISPLGDDNNDGLTTNTPWATITHAWNWVRDRIDPNGQQITFQLAHGNYAGADIVFPIIGPAPILQGDLADNTLCQIHGTNRSAIGVFANVNVFIRGVTLTATGTSADYAPQGWALSVYESYVNIDNINFGACSQGHMAAEQNATIASPTPGVHYTISGSCPNHMIANNGTITLIDITVTLVGTPAFSWAFVDAQSGGIAMWGCTFNGAATGRRYYAHMNGTIETHAAGPNYFPGDTAGTIDSGGQYH